MGGAWLTGGLHALASETGWDPGSADHVVGTSAGAMIGSLCAAGVPPWFMVAHSAGETFEGLTDAEGRPAGEADRSAGAVFRPARGWPRVGPGSLRLIMSTLASPRRHPPAALAVGWLPAGMISTEPLEETVRRVVPEGWGPHDGLWVVATDFESGRRMVFGRDGAPATDLAPAVAASCAIPGFYRPVTIAGRRYVDGGVCSPSNLDLLRDQDLDLVICLNPLSTRAEPPPLTTPVRRIGWAMRETSGRRLGHEAKKLSCPLVVIQPTLEDIDMMGPNPMSSRNRHAVVETAVRSVAEQLRAPEVSALLAGLPAGEPHRIERPEGPPSAWPPLRPEPQPA